jgi:hypothetical protein
MEPVDRSFGPREKLTAADFGGPVGSVCGSTDPILIRLKSNRTLTIIYFLRE